MRTVFAEARLLRLAAPNDHLIEGTFEILGGQNTSVAAASETATDVTTTVDIALQGKMRLLAPVLALFEGAQSRRISQAMARAIEGAIDPGVAHSAAG